MPTVAVLAGTPRAAAGPALPACDRAWVSLDPLGEACMESAAAEVSCAQSDPELSPRGFVADVPADPEQQRASLFDATLGIREPDPRLRAS